MMQWIKKVYTNENNWIAALIVVLMISFFSFILLLIMRFPEVRLAVVVLVAVVLLTPIVGYCINKIIERMDK